MPNNPPVEQLMPSDYTNSSVSHVSPNPNSYLYRIRSRLLILLGIMFGLSFSYLLFLGISCIPGLYPWLCEYFNKRYEFAWACISLIFDGFWILLTYQYHVRGLRVFGWFGLMFLVIFVIFLVVALLRFCHILMELNHLAIEVIISSILSIIMCIGTILLQVVIIISSFKLSALSEINQRAVSE